MIPRLAPAYITKEVYARDLFGADAETLGKVPVQWRGFVLFNKHLGHTVNAVLDLVSRDPRISFYDPQATFNTYNGQAPE